MKTLLLILTSVLAYGSVGDHAPSVPAGYVLTHPRVAPPDSTFLASLYNGGTYRTHYKTDADAWDSTNPGTLAAFRSLLLAYLASKQAGAANGTYLQKINDMRLMAGAWTTRLYSVTDGVGSGGSGYCTPTCTVTTTAGNFLTGCSGGSCSGRDLAILGSIYTISSVSGDGKVATLTGAAFPVPSGSSLIAAVLTPGTNPGSWNSAYGIALAYDWIYSDLDSAARTEFFSELDSLCSMFEVLYVTSGASPSPYNDQLYITGYKQVLLLIPALAMYPDNPTRSLPHLRFAMDVWFNSLIPVWKQVIGGGGLCGASSDLDIGCGGGWHEGWTDYVAGAATRMNNWYVPSLIAWWKATGDNIFTREPWIKNYAYWTMYTTRPDFSQFHIGAASRNIFVNEYDGASTQGSPPGSLEGLASIYNDSTLRGWARLMNWGNVAPNGYEPSAWPFYSPDSSANTANGRSVLAKTKDFPGWGTIFFRTGWGEDDTACSLRYGDNFWSHPVMDTGAFECFKQGYLAITSGSYRPGSASRHFTQYTTQAIARNLPLVYDPADIYASELVPIQLSDGSSTSLYMPNDGGQRRVGSGIGNIGNMSTPQQSPADLAQWMRNREYYRQGVLQAYAVGSGNKYSYAAIDMTGAYNNLFSHNAHAGSWAPTNANTSNRSYRVQKAVRQFLFIPRGTAAYVIVYDQLVSTNSSFTKKWLLHSVNAPSVSGNSYTVTRADLVTSKPFSGLWPGKWAGQLTHCPGGCTSNATQYQYSGKLYGWVSLPSSPTITTIGGAGHEFEITDTAGTANYNECMIGQGCGDGAEGLGTTTLGFLTPEPLTAPHEPGSYRIEQAPASSNLTDYFLNVMLFTSSTDTNVVSTAPVSTLTGTNYVTVWKDNANTCTYTVTLPQSGVGGTMTAIGAGCAAVIN